MQINELSKILNGYFGWNKARMHCFVNMLVSLIEVRTVNLAELVCGFAGKALPLSKYQRMQRFFRHIKVDMNRLAYWVMSVFNLLEQPVYLSLDRTNWQWGKQPINILMLSVVYKGIALPLCWQLLAKQGNSDTDERIALIQRFIAVFGKEAIAAILADREFIGDKWFGWLQKEKIGFCIRIKNNTITTNSRGLLVDIDSLFYELKPGQWQQINTSRKLYKQQAYLAALRLANGQLLIVATARLMDNPIETYGKRWQIECLFGCLKSKGFRFEDTHITKPERIDKLLVLLTIAFCWAHKIGEWQHQEKPIAVKKHQRPGYSLFRYGLDYLRTLMLQKSSRKLWHTVMDKLQVIPSNIRVLT